MPPVRILSFEQVQAILAALEADQILRNQAQAFFAFKNNQTQTPQRVSTTSKNHTTLYMPARIDSMTSVVKIVSVPLQSSPFGLPGFTVVLDNDTAEARGLVNARLLTAIRTAAGSALATKIALEARSRSKQENTDQPLNLVIFGSGAQAKAHVQLIVQSVPKPFRIAKVTVVNRTAPRGEALVRDLGQLFPSLPLELVLTGAEPTSSSLEQAVRQADIICTCTNSNEPLFNSAWVRPGTHLNLVGSYKPEMQEIDQALVQRSHIVVDSIEACAHEAGELLRAQRFKDEHPDQSTYRGILTELGGLVDARGEILHDQVPSAWKKIGSSDEKDDTSSFVTLFKSVGIAAQDVAITCLVLEKAEANNVGSIVDL
ncbi:hypothetical protein BGZ73_008751 [Actinomortierella ambigua]|nr:hypothetical protein BGZ73_008751 [Actinomortierella ambigua]